jgi:REP element-mobilizing transposase RayT
MNIADGIYHVTSRGLEQRAIVRDDADRRKWLELLDSVAMRRRWRVFAWALMTNHFHLFLETPDGDLSEGMHDLNSGYASTFNRRHGRCGPLFQSRFKAILVEREAHDWELTRYIHLNPVRAGMEERPEEYPWSSCRAYFDSRRAPEWLAWEHVLIRHGRTLRVARRAYRQYLEDGMESTSGSPFVRVVASTMLGSPGFVARMRAWLGDHFPGREVPQARAVRATVDMAEIERAVCAAFGVGPDRLRERRRRQNDARAAAIYLCRKLTGTPMAELGAAFGDVTGQAASRTSRALEARLPGDRRLARILRDCEDIIRADSAES